jgi:hypothetical protein
MARICAASHGVARSNTRQEMSAAVPLARRHSPFAALNLPARRFGVYEPGAYVEARGGRPRHAQRPKRRSNMAESVYKVIELVGTSPESWEKAAAAAINQASKSLRDLRVAEVSQLDLTLDNGKVESYRARVKVSFKYEM